MIRTLIAAVSIGLAAGYGWSELQLQSVHPHIPKAVNPKPIVLAQSAADEDWSERARDRGVPALEQIAPDPTRDRDALEHSVYYARCDEARAAGNAPILSGQPGYRRALDADGDGIACEPYLGN
jgi:hypothetical protein